MRFPVFRFFLPAVFLIVFPLVVIIPMVSSADLAGGRFVWSPRSDAPIDRVEGIGALVGDQLYVMSGFKDPSLTIALQVDVYDVTEDRWTPEVSVMPGEGVTHINPAVDGTDIWIAGGFAGDHPGPAVAEVWRYDTALNAWFAGPALPEARSSGSLVLVERRLHYVGGFAFRDPSPDANATRATHWALDLDNQDAGWQELAPLPEPLGHLSAVVLGDEIYTVGGQLRHDWKPEDRAPVYAYDVAADEWRQRASLPTPRSHTEPGTLTYNGRIFVVGGRDNTRINGPYDLNVVSMYDPHTNVWLDLPQLPFYRLAPVAIMQAGELLVTHGGAAWNQPQRITISGLLDGVWEDEHPAAPVSPGPAGGAIIGRRLFVIGAASEATLAFDLGLGEWEPPATHPPRPIVAGGVAVEAFAGRLYLFGGAGEAAEALQIYDPTEQAWSSGAPLPFAAEDATAVAIGAFIYLVADGQAAQYEPAADRWETLPEGPPVAVRAAAGGTDGAMLYLFGGAVGDAAVAVVQRYDPATGTWSSSDTDATQLVPLPAPRTAAGRAFCSGDAFYLTGGRNTSGELLATTIAYDVRSAAWSEVAAAPTARAAAASALIADRFYVAGGITGEAGAGAQLAVYNAPAIAANDRICLAPEAGAPLNNIYLPVLKR
jgi:N-acetylneuraminic acid mutarotase